ncbi:hypothetical protein [Candidatus Palauibacter sp.]|uniref:AbiU2 domain-containing protein n=1 Tax=Candidatus Palauibacter sp. TaxID=3101350 RepID=UPI003B015AD8
MRQQTHNEMRKRYEDALGSEFGGLLWHLWNDLANARLACDELTFLFGEERHAEELSILGNVFTADIFRTFSESLILRIARLTDPANTGRHRNITIRALPQYLDDNELLRAKVEDLIAEALERTEFARKLRNKHLAHRDLFSADYPERMNLFAEILPKSDAAIKSIHAVPGRVAADLLDEGWVDMISAPPRAGSLTANIGILREIARTIEGYIEPSGDDISGYVDAASAALDPHRIRERSQTRRIALNLLKLKKWGKLVERDRGR